MREGETAERGGMEREGGVGRAEIETGFMSSVTIKSNKENVDVDTRR